jgi:hypothetical protein
MADPAPRLFAMIRVTPEAALEAMPRTATIESVFCADAKNPVQRSWHFSCHIGGRRPFLIGAYLNEPQQ